MLKREESHVEYESEQLSQLFISVSGDVISPTTNFISGVDTIPSIPVPGLQWDRRPTHPTYHL